MARDRERDRLRCIEYRKRKVAQEGRVYLPRPIVSLPSGYKRCTSCKAIKPLREFHKNRKFKDGHGNQCKVCKRIDDRKRPGRSHYVPHPRKPHILTTEELERRRERLRDYDKVRYEAKKDMLLSRCKERYRGSSLTLSDAYIKKMITKGTSLRYRDVPHDLIEVWRLKITLHRELKKRKEATKCTTSKESTT